jgi:Zn-dependent protease with chaperone function
MRSRTSSLAGRAVLAIVLLFGFYALALLIAAGLLFLPYAEMRWANRLHLQLAFFCVVGAGIVLWSALPRPDRFEAPGPRLEPGRQPRLFAVIDRLAERVGQAVPAEVYLIPQVNAWVAQRGGVLGFGGRRVMAIGLPVLHTLTVSELRAVLAHEFGHFHGGDTSLGVFIYQTRAAIQRTVQGLAAAEGRLSALSGPFVAYGTMFLRVTQKISRAQEAEADELAARVAGPTPLAEGLKKLHVMDAAYDGYMRSEFGQAALMGLLPPLGDGFVRFLSAGRVSSEVESHLARVVDEERKAIAEGDGQAMAFESHPRLPVRLDALASLGLPDEPLDDAPAITLLDDVGALDGELAAGLLGQDVAARARRVRWDEVGTLGYLPHYRKTVTPRAAAFAGTSVAELPERLAAIQSALVEAERRRTDRPIAEPGELEREAVWLTGAAVAVAAAGRGFELVAVPGEALYLRGPAGTFHAFEQVDALAAGRLSAEEWRRQCALLGIGGLPLVRESGA